MIALIAIPLIVLAAWFDYAYRKRHPNTATASEWRAGMARLDAHVPLRGPRFRSRYCAKGEPGVSFPEPKKKTCNIAPIRKVGGK